MRDWIMGRRAFVKRCMIAGAGMIAVPRVLRAVPEELPRIQYELCAIRGDRYFENTLRAVDALGGMQKFVPQGSSVGILINSPFARPGTFTLPDIALAVLKMCLEAGARQVHALNDISADYWRRSKYYESMKREIDRIAYSEEKTEVSIAKGKSLKNAVVSAALLSCDVYINIPIIKNHEGTRYTCSLKNVMGVCSSSTCRRIHFGDSSLLNLFKGYYSNIEVLAQGIADLNLIRQPNLCVVDATEILATNGPGGPGEIRRPKEVIASTNCIAADMYATQHLGLHWEDLLVVQRAQEHGYGPKGPRDVRVQTM